MLQDLSSRDVKYKILINKDEVYALAPRCAAIVKALRLLQASSSYYSDEERKVIIKETLLHHLLDDDDNPIQPTVSADGFRDAVAILLFQDAPLSKNLDKIDYEQVEEGLDAFLNFIEPRHRKLNRLLSLLKASPQEGTSNINQETPAED